MNSRPDALFVSLLAVLMAVSLSLSSARAQTRGALSHTNSSERSPLETAVDEPLVPGNGLTAPSYQEMPALPDRQQRPDIPFELTEDPVLRRIEGVDTGTDRIPAFLKGNPYRLSFVGGDYTPPPGQRIDPELQKQSLVPGRSSGKTYGFVMFQGRITADKMKRVESYGVQLVNFHTFQSYTAAIPFAALPRLKGDPAVRWVGYARPVQKLDPEVQSLQSQGRLGPVELLVTCFAPDDPGHPSRRLLSEPARFHKGQGIDGEAWSTLPGGRFQSRLEREGAEIRGYIGEMRLFLLRLPLAKVDRLAALDFVHYIEVDTWMDVDHDRSTKMIGVDRLRGSGLSNGSNTVMGLIDSGAWVRNSANPKGHKDLAKWTWAWDFLGGGALNDTVGHGTHVLGTMMGTGTVNSSYRGCAIAAGLLGTRRVYIAKALPGPSSKAISAVGKFRSAVTSGGQTTPRPAIVNGSYGSTTQTPLFGFAGTDSASIAVDTSVYSYGQTYVMSSGNDGGAYGFPRPSTAHPPGVAKNAFTVGNSYDHKGTASIEDNASLSIDGKAAILKNRFAAIEIRPRGNMHSIPVRGFMLKIKSDRNVTISTQLYLDGGGRPGTLVRSGTMKVTTSATWQTTTFSSPYYTPAGKSFFIGFRTPSNAVIFPFSIGGSKTPYYWHDTSSSKWTSSLFSGWVSSVSAVVEVGELVADSSRGPTKDGRIKPNITAPGHIIRSAKSQTEDKYRDLTGTSMATPHVSGVAAMFQHRNASWRYRPYLTKSMLAAAANPIGGYISSIFGIRNYYKDMGLGCVDAYKATYSYNTASGWIVGSRSSTQTSSTGGFTFDLAIPADADRLMLTLNFDEKAPSTGASRACLADFDLYLDVPPISSAINVGDYSSRRAWDTWEWLHIYSPAVMTKLRGKTVRIKAYPRVKPAKGTTARVGISFCLYRGSHPPKNSVTLQAPAVIQPNKEFRLRATIHALSSVSTHSLLRMSQDAGVKRTRAFYTSGDNLTRITAGILDFTIGNVYPDQNSNQRYLEWGLKATTGGQKQICVEHRSDNHTIGSITSAKTYCKTICVDGTAPPMAQGIRSTTHTVGNWSNRSRMSVTWTKVFDKGCAGIADQAVAVASPGPVTPKAFVLSPSATSALVNLSSSSKGWFFTHRSRDRAGNLSLVGQSGPYFIDTSLPAVTSLQIHRGAKTTSSLKVQIAITATDTFSGVRNMRFSNDGKTWSRWQPFSLLPQTYDLSSLGGNALPGTKIVRAQVMDRAGNLSAIRSATIQYQIQPRITKASGTTWTVVHHDKIVLSGSGFKSVTRVDVGTHVISSRQPGDWNIGWYRILSDTAMEVFPPQNLSPGKSACLVRNAVFASAKVPVQIVVNTVAKTFVPPQLKSGRTLDVYTARGPRPATTLSILTFSLSSKGFLIPGLISMGHGGNTATFIDPSFTILSPGLAHDPLRRTAHWSLPTPPGKVTGKIYWASVMFDATHPTATPIPTSNPDVVLFSK